MEKTHLKLAGIIAFFAFSLLTSLPSYGFDFGARGYYWRPDFSGEVQVDDNSIIGTTIDAENDLGMDDESYPTIEVFFGLGNHHLTLSYTKPDYSGKNNIARNIVFNGQTYTSNTFVESDLKFQMLDLEYQYDFINLEKFLAGFSLGVLAKAKYIEGEARLQAASLGYDEKETFKVPVPMLGLGLHVGLLADILEARVKGAGVIYSGSTFYDAQADLSFTPIPFVAIHGGYRAMKLKIDDISDVSADIEFKGPYAGLTISF
jgi:outer membrane protein